MLCLDLGILIESPPSNKISSETPETIPSKSMTSLPSASVWSGFIDRSDVNWLNWLPSKDSWPKFPDCVDKRIFLLSSFWTVSNLSISAIFNSSLWKKAAAADPCSEIPPALLINSNKVWLSDIGYTPGKKTSPVILTVFILVVICFRLSGVHLYINVSKEAL